MQQPNTEIAAQFFAVAKELGGEEGDAGNYRGIFKHAPFLFKVTSANPPGFMIKLRKIRGINSRPAYMARVPIPPQAEWHNKLSAEYSGAGIRCDVEDDYVFIWIDQPQNLTDDAISSLVTAYVRDHPQYFPTSDSYCFECGSSGSASLVQASSSIATICQECLDRKQQVNVAENEELNASDPKLYALLPLAVVLGGLGWAAFWTGYDAIFRIGHTDTIRVPIIVTGVIVALVGLGIGLPVGRVLHRSGAAKVISHGGLTFLATLLVVVIGELIYTSYIIYAAIGTVDLATIFHASLPFAPGKSFHYMLYRLIFSLAVAGGIYEFSKTKVSKMSV